MTHAILIVDDEPRIFSALRRALHREDYELLSASDADGALKILADKPVDVIIADENMPGMKGSALLARVRQQWPDVVRMMLTGDARLETVVAAVNRGEIFRFFIKPCNEVELIVSIRDALQSRELKQGASRLLDKVKEHTGAPAATKTPAPAHAHAHDHAHDHDDEDFDAPMQPIRLDDDDASHGPAPRKSSRPATQEPAASDEEIVDGEKSGSVFRLGGSEIDDNVDSLLDEIRNELEKLDS
ncbi:MAG: response regulator [Planctomycetota bacterium]|jgi:DNA-binding response OmpR family regulator